MAITEEILVNVTPQETRVAVVEQGVTQEVHIERASSHGLVGNIYMGRVSRVLPGMQSAFIEIGLERAAFLHVADIRGIPRNGDAARPIERLLSEGQNLLVQVVKDPIGTKGARLSTQLSIAGRFLVYLPQESHIGISQRIEDEEERTHLREKLRQLLPPEDTGGYIIRTVAETASDRELKSDLDYLHRLWCGIQERAGTAEPRALIYQDLGLGLRVLRDFAHEETARILVDSRETCRKMLEFGQDFTPGVAERVEHYNGERLYSTSTGSRTRSKRRSPGASISNRAAISSSTRPRRLPPSTSTPAASSAGAASTTPSSGPTSRRRRSSRGSCGCGTSAASSSSTSSTWTRRSTGTPCSTSSARRSRATART